MNKNVFGKWILSTFVQQLCVVVVEKQIYKKKKLKILHLEKSTKIILIYKKNNWRTQHTHIDWL